LGHDDRPRPNPQCGVYAENVAKREGINIKV
jgi:hypothetical protein